MKALIEEVPNSIAVNSSYSTPFRTENEDNGTELLILILNLGKRHNNFFIIYLTVILILFFIFQYWEYSSNIAVNIICGQADNMIIDHCKVLEIDN